MKANMEAMKEQMATMMKAMMSMKEIMEANAVVVAATSTVAKVNPMPSIWPQPNESSNLSYGRQRFGKHGRPPLCAKSKQACLPTIWLASQLYTTQCSVHSQ